jgi:hypothetical protein
MRYLVSSPRKGDDAGGEQDLQIDGVVGRHLDFAIDLFDEVDHGARAMRMTGQEFGFRLDAAREFVELGVGAVHPAICGAAIGVAAVGGTMGCIVLVERAVEFVVGSAS